MTHTFTANPNHHFEGWKLNNLQLEIKKKNLDAFLVPKVDIYRGETLADCDERLAWLTGFTGTAGLLAVSLSKAVLFVDGRYTLEARTTLPGVFEVCSFTNKEIVNWLTENLPDGGQVGFCGLFHSVSEVKYLKNKLKKVGISLVSTGNLVDDIWKEKPSPPVSEIYYYPEELAGETHQNKRLRISKDIKSSGASALLITNPGSIGWLLNIRGNDIPYTPIVHALAILYSNGYIDLFVDPGKLPRNQNLETDRGIRVIPHKEFETTLGKIEGTILIDPDTTPQRYHEILRNSCRVKLHTDPCLAARAHKNATQIMHCKDVQTRDAVAFVEFLSWFFNHPRQTDLTEIDLSLKLWEFRQKQPGIKSPSFETIVGSGPNGAIVHYRVKENTNRKLKNGDLILIDSGAQYIEGTTDLTRTICIGTPTRKQQMDFTIVLKSLISVSEAKWEVGSSGKFIDGIARIPLSKVGEDYNHGTGHGVGQFLEVHEGPHRLSKKSITPIHDSIILSLEPGLYREGEYGIRIENLALTRNVSNAKNDNRQYCFETLTYVPIDLAMILPEKLTREEINWLNRYHDETYSRLNSLLSTEAQAWLRKACQPL